jgi:hypothetical protein
MGVTTATPRFAGINHSLALRSDGTTSAWGRNDYGQLGDDTTTNRSTAGAVDGLPGGVEATYAYDGDRSADGPDHPGGDHCLHLDPLKPPFAAPGGGDERLHHQLHLRTRGSAVGPHRLE